MGLFSRRRSKGFDPDLWSDAKDRAPTPAGDGWADDEPGDELDAIATNTGARFTDDDQDWLADDPGEAIRQRKR